MPAQKSSHTRIGLALVGGGIDGSIYEIGALRAIEEAVDGLDFQEAVRIVGVSAGSFIASCLANGITTSQLCRSILKAEAGEPAFVECTFDPDIPTMFHRSSP